MKVLPNPVKTVDRRSILLGIYEEFPFHLHPFWAAIRKQELTLEQVLRGEIQHFLRTRSGQALRQAAVTQSLSLSPRLWGALLKTYLEECTNDPSGPSHLELIRRLLLTGGISDAELESAQLTPGNSAALALYRDISSRGPGCHFIGAGVVEFYYCTLAPEVFAIYTGKYGMSEQQAETYRIHGPMDRTHAERALELIDEVTEIHGWPAVQESVRDAFVATSLHYDGMLQGALGTIQYWNGSGQ